MLIQRNLGEPTTTSNPFDSWWWRNRKVVALGTVGIFGVGVLALLGKVLR